MRILNGLRALLCLALLFMPLAAVAHDYRAGNLEIGHVWASVIGTNAAVYLPILNAGETADRLTGASTDVAAKVALHESVKEGDVRRMRPINEIVLEPQRPVALKPGGMHIMLTDLKRAYKLDEKIPLTLHFAAAGDIAVEAQVQKSAMAEHRN